MPRARRLASTVVVAALAVTGLAACNRAPSVAAYFGNAKAVTEDQVQSVYDNAQAKFTAVAGGPAKLPLTRQNVVDKLLGVDVLREIAKQRGVTGTAIPADTFVQSVGLPADAEYTKIYTEFQGLLNAIGQKATAVQPTEADLRDVYDRLKTSGVQLDVTSFQQFVSSLTQQNAQLLAGGFTVRQDLRADVDKLHVQVNPRYPAEFSLVDAQNDTGWVALIAVPLGKDTSAPVADLS
jgi:hypothetical protein